MTTNADATLAKIACVATGYYKDEVVKYFNTATNHPMKIDPEIKQGTWARVTAMFRLVTLFCQVGSFVIKPTKCRKLAANASWSTSAAAPTRSTGASGRVGQIPQVRRRRLLLDDREEVARDREASGAEECDRARRGGRLDRRHRPHRSRLAVLLSHRRRPAQREGAARHVGQGGHRLQVGFPTSTHPRCSLPTLFICECVLVYMPKSASAALLAHLSTNFPRSAVVNYEQVNLTDQFSEVGLIATTHSPFR